MNGVPPPLTIQLFSVYVGQADRERRKEGEEKGKKALNHYWG